MSAPLSGATILAIGLIDGPPSDLGALTASQIRTAVQTGVQRAKDAGVTIEVALIDVGDLQTFEDAKTKLRSREKWDAVSLGFGVRGNERFTAWFEEMVNIVLREGRAARVMFPVHPEDLLPSAERVFKLGGERGE